MSALVMVVALAILLVLTLKKVPVPIAALVSVAVLALFTAISGETSFLSIITKDYMEGVVGFIKTAWLMILIGIVLAKLLEVTGAATSIGEFIISKFGAKRVIPAVILSGGLLTYGGMFGLGGCFAVYPIALAMFRKANLPRYLIPGAIASGLFTWVNMLPGNPFFGNVLAGKFLGGTDTMSAPLIGVVTGIMTFILTLLYFNREIKKAEMKGLGFETDSEVEKVLARADEMKNSGTLPNPLISIIPLIGVVVSLNVFRVELWISLLIGVVLCGIVFNRKITGIAEIATDSTNIAAIMTITAAAITGIGSVIKIAPGFNDIMNFINSGAGGNPVAIFGISVTVMAGLCASALTGLVTVLSVLAQPLLEMGVNPEVLHRIGIIASAGLDSLPHSGGIVAIITLTGVSYKEGYKHVFMTTVVVTLIALVVAIVMGSLFY